MFNNYALRISLISSASDTYVKFSAISSLWKNLNIGIQ